MKKFRSVLVLFLIFSMIFSFASCGQPSAEHKDNPMTSGGVDITSKIPDVGFYMYFNVSKDDTKAMQDLQKKLLDAGVSPVLMASSGEDMKDFIDKVKAVQNKYEDIMKSQYGVVALDLKKMDELKDKDKDEIKIGPESGIYTVFVVSFDKEVKVKDYLSDIKGVLDEMKQEEQMENAQMTIDPGAGTMTIKPEEGPEITVYFEQEGKSIIVSLGQPFSKMAKVQKSIKDNAFWKEATEHSFALYLDPQTIPDEKTKEDMIKAGWKEPIRLWGDISSSEKDGVYTSKFVLRGYNPSDKKFEGLGITGDVKVVKDADIILALDTDAIVKALDEMASADEELMQYKQMIDIFAGGVITLSGSVKSMQQMAGAVEGQYFKDSTQIWGMFGSMVEQYLDMAKASMPGLYTKAQKTDDGFDIIAGTFQPDMTTEKIEGSPVFYLKLNIDPAKYKDILSALEPDAAKALEGYAKVIDNAQITLSVTYDEDKNMSGLEIVSVVKTK